MARKRLVKGANAAALEERISRVPADIGKSSGSGDDESIFGAIRAMDDEAPPRAEDKTRKIDFSVAEREAIARCCLDYRNRMPTYLQSTQRELKIIDSVIKKCKSAKSDKSD
jgi:hypothetical protein